MATVDSEAMLKDAVYEDVHGSIGSSKASEFCGGRIRVVLFPNHRTAKQLLALRPTLTTSTTSPSPFRQPPRSCCTPKPAEALRDDAVSATLQRRPRHLCLIVPYRC